ncbi:MAG: hypothetical protein KC620_01735 [Myxococcales bacterium]|nr:hypothetical protein [Myxococcales bacterium]
MSVRAAAATRPAAFVRPQAAGRLERLADRVAGFFGNGGAQVDFTAVDGVYRAERPAERRALATPRAPRAPAEAHRLYSSSGRPVYEMPPALGRHIDVQG